MNLGYYEEAQAWRDWLIRAVAGSPSQAQIMYGVGGERWLPELIVPWLPGYENSSPVRIGNDASRQLQLDIFGEIADAMFQTLKAGMAPSERAHALRPVVLDYLATAWRQPDEGIWEVRGGRQHFVHLRSWRGSHSIARRTSWKRKHSTNQVGDGARSPTKSMPKSVSAVSTATSTASCRPMAPSSSMPVCC